jgi:hypothetical protein
MANDGADDGILALMIDEVVPAPFNKATQTDGAVFELGVTGRAVICLYLTDMGETDVETISCLSLETAYYSRGTFWVGILKVGNLLVELSFDPMKHFLAYGSFSADFFRTNRLVTILGVDTATMILKVIRVGSYPHKFLDSLYLTFANFKPSEWYSEFYDYFLNRISSYSLETLWDNFERAGTFGEKE